MTLALRPMTEADLPEAHRLSSALRWAHRQEDWALLLRLGEGVVAEDAGGTLIGTGMWWPHGPDHATIGMVLVSPDRQGQGIGKRIMAALLDATEGRALMLNATTAGLPLYAALGFATTGEIHQHQGIWTGTQAAGLPGPAEADLPALVAADAAAFGAPRHRCIAAGLETGTGAMAEGGFAIARPFGRGTVIGPVIAADGATAMGLVAALARPGAFTRLDIPARMPAFAAMLAANGLPKVSSVTVMTRGTWHAPAPASRHALMAQALG